MCCWIHRCKGFLPLHSMHAKELQLAYSNKWDGGYKVSQTKVYVKQHVHQNISFLNKIIPSHILLMTAIITFLFVQYKPITLPFTIAISDFPDQSQDCLQVDVYTTFLYDLCREKLSLLQFL
ncbi:hypothetical protein CEXT_594681 [Caerostris extrusa]|uniref:Transmembrane protein n=1 Tax=Caerostris extrusa TaxID=172846 RepID=A0AAV4P619_CAEEX|nr:hypothetical protein CEXT_594681 [Caerostris extrusa]